LSATLHLERILHPLASEAAVRSTARVMDHPIHPMLIPYPFAFLSGAAAFDLVALARGSHTLGQTAAHLRAAGLGSALIAAVPGLIDYLTTVPEGPPRNTATKHLLSNLSALGCFAGATLSHSGRPNAGTIALEVAGTVLLSIGGWLGGSLSYHHQIGVDPEEVPRSLTAPPRTALPPS
jgi:uncharacterized membrane protein